MNRHCQICGNISDNDEHFVGHLKREHKIKPKDYCLQYLTKKDLYTKELIRFKDFNQYVDSDFNTRGNLIQWLNKVDRATGLEYAKKLLAKRKERKGLIYAPCRVEAKSVMLPCPSYFGDDYPRICEELGLKLKYTLDSLDSVAEDYHIQIDTREQKPFLFKGKREPIREKLDYGDYRLFNTKNEVIFERKSLPDLIGTLSSGYVRFEKELARINDYLIILVEEPLNNALYFLNRPHVYSKTRITPEYIFHNIRHLIQHHENIQFLFVNGRYECVRSMDVIFGSEQRYKQVDLQLLYDNKKL